MEGSIHGQGAVHDHSLPAVEVAGIVQGAAIIIVVRYVDETIGIHGYGTLFADISC